MKHTRNSLLARALHGFLTDYLPRQRAMSPHTLLAQPHVMSIARANRTGKVRQGSLGWRSSFRRVPPCPALVFDG
jgi:hypothetical protein